MNEISVSEYGFYVHSEFILLEYEERMKVSLKKAAWIAGISSALLCIGVSLQSVAYADTITAPYADSIATTSQPATTVSGGGGAGNTVYDYYIAPGYNDLYQQPGGETYAGSFSFDWTIGVTENNADSITWNSAEVSGGSYSGEGGGAYGPAFFYPSAEGDTYTSYYDYGEPIGGTYSVYPNATETDNVNPQNSETAEQYIYTDWSNSPDSSSIETDQVYCNVITQEG
ncbi:MAG: hypothetical protein OWT27_08405 [Firmicutes bacterium]|nr:hypothetical protein [Bacillota bacterium]